MTFIKPIAAVDIIQAPEILQALLEYSKDMIFVKDEKFRILYANKIFLDMYDPDLRDSIIGTTTIEKFSEEEAAVFLREDLKAFEQGSAELIEELTDYTGKKRLYQSHKLRFRDKYSRTLMLGICKEITDWAEREKALAQNNLILENFATVAAHDLRSPLASYLTAIEIISMDKQSQISPQSRKLLDMMKESGHGLVVQIDKMLSTYKTSSQTNVVDLNDVDVGVIAEEIKFNLSQEINDYEVTIRSSALPVVKADRHLFRQLLHNLIANSIKYRSAERPIIIIRYERLEEEHLFSVEDNGKGIAKDKVQNVFNLFEQADASADGLGIGLSLCRKIVELHKGSIWVDTSYKDGSKICFAVPVQI